MSIPICKFFVNFVDENDCTFVSSCLVSFVSVLFLQKLSCDSLGM